MTHRPLHPFFVACLAAAACALAAPHAGAQTPPQPTLSPDEQIAPRQVQTVPAAKPKPRPAPARSVPPADAPAPGDDAGTAPRRRAHPRRRPRPPHRSRRRPGTRSSRAAAPSPRIRTTSS
jgi:hypothetical protein